MFQFQTEAFNKALGQPDLLSKFRNRKDQDISTAGAPDWSSLSNSASDNSGGWNLNIST